MLVISQMPEFGFGNKILYYFNLRQESYKIGSGYYCCPFDGLDLFQGNMTGETPVNNSGKEFPLCLGERFFSDAPLNSFDVFKLKTERDPVNYRICSIHFRGTDFHQWNPKSILDSSYYLSAIEEIMGDVDLFMIFTDDKTLDSFKKTVDFLLFSKKEISMGTNDGDRKKFKNDFIEMSNSDIVISSPSTFCISAGIVQREKKIIHSKEWIDSRVSVNDTFWVKLLEGGNNNYKLWKTF